MRAVVVNEFGPLESLQLGDLPTPQPGPGEVLVDIRATAANYVDLLVISGGYQFLPDRPFAPGKGPAGIVQAVGDGVTGVNTGDRVLAMAEHGGYAESVAVRADQCYALPDAMTFVDAAAMALVYDTAWFALKERARFAPGDSVLVMGASGGVGSAAVQLGKAWGAKVLAGLSSPAKASLLPQADGMVDLSRPDLRDALREQVYAETGGAGVDIVLDPLGGDYFDAALRALAWRGRLVVIGFAAGRIPTVKANYLLLKNIEISGLQISDYRKRAPAQMAECFAEVFALFKAGKITPAPAATLPLEDFRNALGQIRDRSAHGRLVLTQSDALGN